MASGASEDGHRADHSVSANFRQLRRGTGSDGRMVCARSDGVGGLGAAVKYLSQSPSGNEGSASPESDSWRAKGARGKAQAPAELILRFGRGRSSNYDDLGYGAPPRAPLARFAGVTHKR